MNLNQLNLFAEDSHASLFPLPGSEGAREMTVTSGRKCLELLKPSDPLGYFVKMLLESLIWHSTVCYLTWKVRATPAGHLLFRLVPSMPRTEETGYGLWATPNACEDRAEKYTQKTTQKHIQEGRQIHLSQQVKLWPTPTTHDGTQVDPPSHQDGRRHEPCLGTQVNDLEGIRGGQLNPQWVEWLMGFPIGWTDLNV